MSEKRNEVSDAIGLAHLWLDTETDPDSDKSILARQYIRRQEECDRLKGQLRRLEAEMQSVRDWMELNQIEYIWPKEEP